MASKELNEKLLNKCYDADKEVIYGQFVKEGVLLRDEEIIEDQDNYVCSVCKKKLMSAYLLGTHFQESHDTLFKLQSQKKSLYECFLEPCHMILKSPKERKDHCINEHKFPHDFNQF